jgi:hypothetical protein
MARRHHYERAFEEYVRRERIPYVSVDEARKALLPEGASLGTIAPGADKQTTLKSFDYVIYGQSSNLLVDIKGRKVTGRRLESWVTQDDVDSLTTWQALFGEGFEAAFVFVYWCDEQPPDALFQEVFTFHGRWYALRAITLVRYKSAMKVRSPRWRTVHLPTAAFAELSQPFCSMPMDRGGPPTGDGVGPDLPALQPLGPAVGSRQ